MPRIEDLYDDDSNVIFKVEDVEIELDLLESATHTRTATVPEDPIESGAVTDQIINGQPVVSIQGFVTNYPVKAFGVIRGLIGDDAERVQNVFDALEDIYTRRVPFSLLTRRKQYDNMVFESLILPESLEDEVNAMSFSATCKEINIQEAITVSIPEDNLADDDKGRMQSQTDAGKQPTTPANPAEEAGASVLFGIFG